MREFNPIPKPRYKEEREEKKRKKKNTADAIASKVKSADGGKCQNPECPAKGYPKFPYRLESAHISPRSLAGPTEVGWEITLCSYPCHYWADEGKQEGTRMVSGPEYMLRILSFYVGKPNDRWEEARKHLIDRMGIRRGEE